MKRLVLGLVAVICLACAKPAVAHDYRVGFYGSYGAYYPVYRPYWYGPPPPYYYPPPAYYYPPPPPVYAPYPVYPGVGVGYYSPGFSISVGR